MSVGKTIVVSNIPAAADLELQRDKLTVHFQRKRNGGGDVVDLTYPYDGCDHKALITFQDERVTQRVLEHRQLFDEKCELHVECHKSIASSKASDDIVPFSQVRAIVSDDILGLIKDDKKSVFDRMADESGATWSMVTKKGNDYYTINGDYQQFVDAQAFLLNCTR
ncbi:RNA-binding protein 43-like [Ptychodera flava]|uniref:RNA-binding protein 43-like n=1 Tax=Ptychodera flava TaxID=63121 RepID=UPI00396A610B